MWQALHEAFTLHTTVCESSGFWWLPFTATSTFSPCLCTHFWMCPSTGFCTKKFYGTTVTVASNSLVQIKGYSATHSWDTLAQVGCGSRPVICHSNRPQIRTYAHIWLYLNCFDRYLWNVIAGCIQYYTSHQAHLLTAHVMLRTCNWPMSVNPSVEKNAYCFFYFCNKRTLWFSTCFYLPNSIAYRMLKSLCT